MNSIFDLPIFCINLKKDIYRKLFINMQFHKKNIHFIDAVYGKNLDDTTKKFLKENSIKNYFSNEKVLDPEIGCLLSHIKTYNEALSSTNSDYIIVIEDDINITNFYNKKADEYVMQNLYKYDCIQLCIIIGNHIIKRHESDNIFTKDFMKIVDWNKYTIKNHPWGCFWSTGCYIISRKAMTKILNNFIEFNIDFRPADYYIYEQLNTGVLLEPLAYPSFNFSNIHDASIDSQNISNKFLLDTYHPNGTKLVLITIWFGKLPEYFNLWLYSVYNKNYDVLFITDQNIINPPSNLKILYMNLEELNKLINLKLNFNIKIKNSQKLVDLKPAFGKLFYEFIHNYDYWGWTDVDMIMGNLVKFLDNLSHEKFELFSFGMKSFGPMMIFKNSLINMYEYIDNYDSILDDEYVCKVDESWWFKNRHYTIEKKIYLDEKVSVKYYKGNKMVEFFETKKMHIFNWKQICIDINWNIKNEIWSFNSLTKYKLNNEDLFKNNVEICFCNLTQLKCNDNFIKNLSILKDINMNYPLELTIKHSLLNPIKNESELIDLNTYEIYDKFVNTNVEINICLTTK